MKSRTMLIVLLSTLLLTSTVLAQEPASQERTDRLRQELTEIQARETELRVRLEQLNEAVKPENIERSLAGVGSTKPEELREHRRRALTIERDGVANQLSRLEQRRVSLESAIATAESEAYIRSAQPVSSPSTQMFVTSEVPGWPWLRIAWQVGLGILLLGAGAAIGIARRKRSS